MLLLDVWGGRTDSHADDELYHGAFHSSCKRGAASWPSRYQIAWMSSIGTLRSVLPGDPEVWYARFAGTLRRERTYPGVSV